MNIALKALIIALALAIVFYLAFRLTVLRRLRRRAVMSELISDLTPKIEDARELVQVCKIAESPATIIEAGIALLFASHKAVLAAIANERVRHFLLPPIQQDFLSRFASLARNSGLSEQRLIELISRRLATYGALMNQSLPDWQHRLPEQLYENISGRQCESALYAAGGFFFLTRLTATCDFVKTVSSKWI